MAGQENLIPMSERTKEEVREIARKGGINSGKARKEKKLMREQAELLLSLPVKSKNLKKQLQQLGIKNNEMNNQILIIVGQWQKAIKGDTAAASWLREMIGEAPIKQVSVNAEVNNPFSGLTTEELRELVNSEQGTD